MILFDAGPILMVLKFSWPSHEAPKRWMRTSIINITTSIVGIQAHHAVFGKKCFVVSTI